MEIKVLGPGCGSCMRLERNACAAVAELGIEATVIKVTGWNDILAYDIGVTPALVIDEKLVSSGRVPNKAEITSMITTALAEAEGRA